MVCVISEKGRTVHLREQWLMDHLDEDDQPGHAPGGGQSGLKLQMGERHFLTALNVTFPRPSLLLVLT